ncbi:hypothetical protein SKAU_G00344390 [Synaphobranchus kaupii]|uniref:Pyrin domain-containing protein n=1 Tax=Synaphobranchus kaupii TaxID=118154 RepID=A0A9Q1EJ60_SYNKA|nr:hypothetical protein SKAU_G00344390 [Synaphobranchus kaupii]
MDNLILAVLDNLSADDLIRFKQKLSAEMKIGYGLTERENNALLMNRIVNKFTKARAISGTAHVLREINLNEEADNLEKRAKYLTVGRVEEVGARQPASSSSVEHEGL